MMMFRMKKERFISKMNRLVVISFLIALSCSSNLRKEKGIDADKSTDPQTATGLGTNLPDTLHEDYLSDCNHSEIHYLCVQPGNINDSLKNEIHNEVIPFLKENDYIDNKSAIFIKTGTYDEYDAYIIVWGNLFDYSGIEEISFYNIVDGVLCLISDAPSIVTPIENQKVLYIAHDIKREKGLEKQIIWQYVQKKTGLFLFGFMDRSAIGGDTLNLSTSYNNSSLNFEQLRRISDAII